MKRTHQTHRKPAHPKPAHRKAAHRKPAHHKQTPEKAAEAPPAQAAENRGYDAYDVIDAGYDVRTDYVDDIPPDIDPVTRGGTDRETLLVDIYSRP